MMTQTGQLQSSSQTALPMPAIADCPFSIGKTPLRCLGITLNGLSHEVWLKEEFRNEFGSTKDRVAWYILYHAMASNPQARHFLDASSGNYGYALASIGQKLGLEITIVSSPSISQFNADGIRRTGATLMIAQANEGESSNAARIRVAADTAARNGAVFLNQYSNALNPESHRVWTAPEVFSTAPLDACFVTASSGGTGRGFSDYITEAGLETELVFVEPSGSKAFADAVPGSMSPSLPGYGTSRRSSFAGLASRPHTLRIDEASVIAAFSLFQELDIAPIGLSSIGIVLGALDWLSRRDKPSRIACVCADGDNRYVDEFGSRYRTAVGEARFQEEYERLNPLLASFTQPAGTREPTNARLS